MLFSVTGAHVWCCLNLFVYPFVGPGARGRVVGTAGYAGGCINYLAGVGLLVNHRVVLIMIIIYFLKNA